LAASSNWRRTSPATYWMPPAMMPFCKPSTVPWRVSNFQLMDRFLKSTTTSCRPPATAVPA
jgi:hypothetical protein